MRPMIDDIEIPKEGLEMTKERCFEIIQEHSQETKSMTILRLYRLQLTNYVQMALIGILLMLVIAYFSPSSRIPTVSLYFFLLGISATYEIYKQSIYNVDELLSTVYLNPGRCFLYKCLLCSLVQFVCFLLIVLIHVAIFQEDLSLVILNSIFPIYMIQCLAILFEKFIMTRKSVLIIYIVAYTCYINVFTNTVLLDPFFTSLPFVLSATLISIVFFLVLLLIKYYKIEREGLVL